MKRLHWLIYVLMSSALILIFWGGLATAAEEKYPTVFKKEAPKEAEELFITPDVTSQGGAQSVIDTALFSQGLYFTPGGVRPIEPGQGGGFPDVSNIHFIRDESPK